jgi:IS30 family transposase
MYDGDLAHARAREEARRTRRPLLAREPELRRIVQDKLEQEWSPAQIASHLREAYPDRTEWHLCHETIYQALYHGGEGGLSRTLTKKLRTGRPLRNGGAAPSRGRRASSLKAGSSTSARSWSSSGPGSGTGRAI